LIGRVPQAGQATAADRDAAPRLEPSAGSPGLFDASGDWLLGNAGELAARLDSLSGNAMGLDGSGIRQLDSAGALLLLLVAARLGVAQDRITVRDEHGALFRTIAAAQTRTAQEPVPGQPPLIAFLTHIGKATVTVGDNLRQLLGFLGLTMARVGASLVRPRRIPITSVVHHMEQSGLDALPLVALLSFLVGAVIAFLGATVLRDFGAELFVIDLTSYAFLREFGVILTAILLAGRTASAFTAQIGTMKSREEIDAMRTLGLDPIDLLVLPRLLALLVVLPLLSVLATLAGIAGGMAVAWLSLGIGPELFVNHLYETIELRHYMVGVGKAPVFAVVIALVGCLEGFKVEGTAQSVGEHTTSAVVQAITLVILIDAFAAIFFMEMGW
jgi:phospholipid/cholesterol/gamma-HCH transport system permease protein